jgi:hypothetical protein
MFEKGHRIGLAISNADFPEFKPYYTAAVTTIHFAAEHPAFIEIPALPAYELPPKVAGVEADVTVKGIQLSWQASQRDVV